MAFGWEFYVLWTVVLFVAFGALWRGTDWLTARVSNDVLARPEVLVGELFNLNDAKLPRWLLWTIRFPYGAARRAGFRDLQVERIYTHGTIYNIWMITMARVVFVLGLVCYLALVFLDIFGFFISRFYLLEQLQPIFRSFHVFGLFVVAAILFSIIFHSFVGGFRLHMMRTLPVFQMKESQIESLKKRNCIGRVFVGLDIDIVLLFFLVFSNFILYISAYIPNISSINHISNIIWPLYCVIYSFMTIWASWMSAAALYLVPFRIIGRVRGIRKVDRG